MTYLATLLLAVPTFLAAADVQEIKPISLAGVWQCTRTVPIVRLPGDSGMRADPGPSPRALAIANGEVAGITWETQQVPKPWDRCGDAWKDYDGEAVFTRQVEIADPGAGTWDLALGSIDDFDVTWVNGVLVGSTDKSKPGAWAFSRHYLIPPGVLKSGSNRVVVRVFDQFGEGGFTGNTKDLVLRPMATPAK